MKVNRYEKARKLLSIIRQGRVSNVLFTDEKFFTSTQRAIVIISWASKYFGSQNWATAHRGKTTVELCQQQFPDF
uniref:Uncharacterized protein n=1 Tax=Heterorhabditis bacteriophora TaxID=37862 RepID=A0A1I7XLJ5_HETBA